jgi:type IV pilus assembly protein PilB
MARINQTQVRPEIDFTFSKGLRALVRQDPDVIMVGEIRDGETASLAVNASLTGHLVLSTLHTNSAAGAIPRLMDMGVEPFLLSSTIRVVIAQRLVRKLFGQKESYTLTKEEIASLGKFVDIDKVLHTLKEEKIIKDTAKIDDLVFYKPVPSEDSQDGYKGRMVINEVLNVSSTINDLILKRASSDEIEEQARAEGMLTMAEDGFFKAAQGSTSIEEVLRVIND